LRVNNSQNVYSFKRSEPVKVAPWITRYVLLFSFLPDALWRQQQTSRCSQQSHYFVVLKQSDARERENFQEALARCPEGYLPRFRLLASYETSTSVAAGAAERHDILSGKESQFIYFRHERCGAAGSTTAFFEPELLLSSGASSCNRRYKYLVCARLLLVTKETRVILWVTSNVDTSEARR